MVIVCEWAGQDTSLFQESIIPVDLFEDDPPSFSDCKAGKMYTTTISVPS